MVKRYHSIGTKITLITLAAILVSVLLIGSIGIYAIKREGDSDTSRQMNLICDVSSKSIDEYLKDVEQSVNMVSRFAAENLSSVELLEGGVTGAAGRGDFVSRQNVTAGQRQSLEDYLILHTDNVEKVFRSVASHTRGVISFYYRINPEISMGQLGFLYSRGNSSQFTRVELTDLFAYDPGDTNHVGWYYTPLQNGGPTWLLPYNNENLNEEMISFVVPIYKAGTFIGVIGMDIAYRTLTQLVRSIRVFQSGYAYLAKEDGTIIYHPSLDPSMIDQEFARNVSPTAPYLGSMSSTGETTIPYTYNGVSKEMAFTTLSNGMKLIVVAPEREINATWHRLVRRIVILALVILSAFALVTTLTMQRIILPLKRLTIASQHMISGKFDVPLDYTGRDEVGILTEAFRKLTDHLQFHLSELNSKAYLDALTGTRNKGSFDIFSRKLNVIIRAADEEHMPEFAIVMMDCNGLKHINDEFGHGNGDIFLKTACRLICNTFVHSPVFRIGGDEFIVLLQNVDYDRREALLAEFDSEAARINAEAENAWNRVDISKGMAVFDPQLDNSVSSVLTRADGLMYENKRKCKCPRNEDSI